ncbi:MAG: cytidylate kinase-like family protein [Opitutales bacterium]
MKAHPSFAECRGYVAAHMHERSEQASGTARHMPALTISRQAGARGRTIGLKLQEALRRQDPKAKVPWTLFDDNLVKQVLEDHKLPADLEKFMPDDAVGELEGTINELLGRHPSLWTLYEKTVSTMVRLSRMGHAILVGRGGNEITRGFSNVIRIRLIGSESERRRQMTQAHGMSESEARKFIKKEDDARRRFIKQHFSTDIDDPMRYDIVFNTDHLGDDCIVRMLVAGLTNMEKL